MVVDSFELVRMVNGIFVRFLQMAMHVQYCVGVSYHWLAPRVELVWKA